MQTDQGAELQGPGCQRLQSFLPGDFVVRVNFQGQFGQTYSKPQGLLPGAGPSFVKCLFFPVKKRIPERKSRNWLGHI